MSTPFARALIVLALLPLAAHAGTPSSGTLSQATPELSYTYGPNFISNPSPQAQPGGICSEPAQPCDHYDLTVDLPADFATTNPEATIRIETTWNEPADDYDIYLLKPDDSIAKDAASSDNPEIMEVPAGSGMQSYRIRIIPFAVSASTATTTIRLVTPPPPPPDEDGDGVTDASDLCPGTPPGTSVDGTGCEIIGPPGPECAAPGLEVLTDADDDHTEPNDNQAFDIRSLKIAEENLSTGKKLHFTLKVDSLQSLPSSSARWIVTFKGADSNYYFLTMIKFADQGAPQFQFGPAASPSGETTTGPGCFADTGALDPHSSFDPDGTIRLIVNAGDIGSPAGGQSLTEIVARAQALNGTSLVCGASTNYDTAAAPSYKVSNSCPLIVVKSQELPTGLPPRFYDFQSPPSFADGAGEPTIGYNPATKNSMFIAGLEVDRVTYAENSDLRDAAGQPLPEACDPVWQNKSYAGAANTLDPILETEQTTGRTFQSQLSGANSVFAFSDDDGDSWIPAQIGPPNGGADHQTVGVGPWAPGAKPPTATEDYAVYYCSQSIAAAFCSRSDNGGLTFGPGIDFRDSLADCNSTIGGLHGHVQVARNDGAVYVPFGNCGGKVGYGRSFDSGITWDVKTIPQSAGGDDPGLGVANDGTLYMCYSEGEGGRAYASVSRDRGETWEGHYDLGIAVGVKSTVFLTAVAGDSDRAACAFLGSATQGNTGALDFPGIWYPYVSTTYDGGKTWHTVNVAPNDPVQGAGGICQAGTTCGSNRNLLDFNDIIMDEEGRVMFGYSDGCIGTCVQNPANNSFTDNGVIARQSGGRTLLAAFDGIANRRYNAISAVPPGAACARKDLSERTDLITRVVWTAPDDGGGPITNYKVYRSLDAFTGFTFVGDAGPKTQFIDATADPAEDTYYYKVVAENAAGAAGESNVIELPLTVPEYADSCTLPGITAVVDASGDSTGGVAQTDIQRVNIAELPDDPDNLQITIKVGNLTVVPPGTYWFILTTKKGGGNIFVSMDSEGGINFRHGTYVAGAAGLLTFTNEGTLPGSSYDPNGSIRLVVPRSVLGDVVAGDVISPLDVRTRQGIGTAPSRDTAAGDYQVRGIAICAPNNAPKAVLNASPQTGPAPLNVLFDASASSDPDTSVPDTVATYVISFGDGTGASATDGTPPIWTHTYSNPGPYKASLTVFDSRGKRSENNAEWVIEVGGVSSLDSGGGSVGNNKVGGALLPSGLGVLSLLAALALGRRRLGRS